MSNNQLAYETGFYEGLETQMAAFTYYRENVAAGIFEPSVSASVCFVAGYLGNDFPSNDDRVTA